MKKFALILLAAALCAVACNKKDDPSSNTPLTVNFTISPEKIFAGDAVSFAAQVSGGVKPYT